MQSCDIFPSALFQSAFNLDWYFVLLLNIGPAQLGPHVRFYCTKLSFFISKKSSDSLFSYLKSFCLFFLRKGAYTAKVAMLLDFVTYVAF